MISGTVRLIIENNLIISRRYSNKHLIRTYIEKWRQLYALDRKNYEVSILPDIPEVNEIKFDSYIEKINKMSQEKKEPKKQNQVVLAALDKLPVTKIAEDPRVHKKFVNLYKQIHGNDKGDLIYNAEKFHFGKLLQEKPELKKCTPLSLYGAFLDVAVQGLSLDPTKKLCYLVPYGTTANLQISGYGELQLRMDYGQVRYVDKPVIVYDCDTYEISTDSTGKKSLKYKKKSPRPEDAKVIASFLRITRNDGTIEVVDFDKEDFDRWRKSSKQPNSPAWKDHYPAMIATKTIKHAFNTYPKLMLKGQFSQLETDTDDNTEDVDYTFVDEETGEVVGKKEDVFGDAPDNKKEQIVTAEVDDEEDDEEETF